MELKRKVIDGAAQGPHLLITGGVHGDEFEPMAAIRRLIQKLGPGALRGTLTLVPVVNEAAFRRQHRWAEDGLDLARSCPGRPDGSVTQRTAHALSQFIRCADFYIDLHTGGTTMSVWPMTGYSLHPDGLILDRQRAMARAFNLPMIWATSPTLDGRSLSVARDAHVPAIYGEYCGPATLDHEGVKHYVAGCLNVMGALGMIDREPPPTRVKYVVEDKRENSGHMQIQNITPVEGFFEPAVQLGQRIRIGDPIGTVCDILGEQVHTVRSEKDGIVLVLKTFCHVDQGDSVGVVVEVDQPLVGLVEQGK